MFFYLRKQEAGIRAEQIESIRRVQLEKAELQIELTRQDTIIADRELQIDNLRANNRTLEDQNSIYKRQPMLAQVSLESGRHIEN